MMGGEERYVLIIKEKQWGGLGGKWRWITRPKGGSNQLRFMVESTLDQGKNLLSKD